SHYEPGHLFVFRTIALTHSVQGDIVAVTERANIRHLTEPGDTFTVPFGFKEEQQP
ncbi:MAG: hypothetical protein JO165_02075, partial [Candidatus Eremiobacteraeota bacterium]|nr:hypothetical protein [Candidatus Eremiobacteraeota bacterium]